MRSSDTVKATPWSLSTAEVHFPFWFIQGSIMYPEMHWRLRRCRQGNARAKWVVLFTLCGEEAMTRQIKSVHAMEILDSRGNPTLRVFVALDNGISASASVPSGASTGEHEAVELRDGDSERYGGRGVLKAAAHVNGTIAPTLVGMDPVRQGEMWPSHSIRPRVPFSSMASTTSPSQARGGGQIKTGSACRGERIAKYNRLLEIEAELGHAAVFDNPLRAPGV